MENYTYSSYPDSGNSSPRSREIDCENAAWDEPANFRVKFMCSYGGKISPRPHDNQLSYVGGDTKILTVDRSVRFSTFISKLSSLLDSSSDFCFKYQLPGEDLDALISVTNDEDLDHMMLEYDRLHRGSGKPARLRLFLFPISSNSPFPPPAPDSKPDRQWFVDALNSAPPIQTIEVPSPPASAAAASNPDFLFGFDKAAAKLQDPAPEAPVPEGIPPPVPAPIRSEIDRQAGVDQVTADLQRQIHELQRLQIQDQQARAFQGDYYPPKPQEKPTPQPQPQPHQQPQPQQQQPPPSAAPVPVQMPVPPSYWPDRQMAPQPPPSQPTAVTIGPSGVNASEQPVYLVQAPVYRPQVAGQGYYVQRMMPEMYREPPPPSMYGAGPPQAQKLSPYGDGGVRPQAMEAAAGAGYTGMAYDSAGRQVYYTSAPAGVMPTYQTVTGSSVDVRQVPAGAVLSQEPKVVKPPQQS